MVPPMPKLSAQYGRLPTSALLIRELTPPHELAVPKAETPSCQKKRMWQPYGSTHAQIFSAPHGRLSAPALLKRELTPPHKLAVPKSRNPLKQAVISVNE